jgi:hypothetical protein
LSAADRKQLERQTPTATAARRKTTGSHGLSWWWLVAVPALLLPVPGLVRAGQRHRRWQQCRERGRVAHAGWAELRAGAIDAGVDWVDGISPRAVARLVVAETALDASASAALQRLVQAEELARYAARPTGPDPVQLRADVTAVTRAMVAGLPMGRRLAVVAWPRSTMRTARGLLAAVADGLNVLDAAGARLRAAVQPPRWSS